MSFQVVQLVTSWWRHDMEMLQALLALCERIHRALVDFPHKGPVMWCFDIFASQVEQTLNK